MKIGDYIKYSVTATGAFIPYGDEGYYLKIKDVSIPDNILVDILHGSDDLNSASLVDEDIPANWYILNNNSLQHDWQICPLQNQSDSKIVEYWIPSNLQNITGIFGELERSAIQLNFSYNINFCK